MKHSLLAVAAVLVAAGCLGGDYDGLTIQDAWARPVPEVATTAGFFLTIDNNSDVAETLVGAETDACRVTEIHQSTLTDGVASMNQVEGGIAIPAFGTVRLEPGGLHIMCIDKVAAFGSGDEIAITLEFVTGDGAAHSEAVTAVVEDR